LKKILSKLLKTKNNSGSGIILVIVALGFIGILTGALLTAVGYAYRLKLYDYNARDNFYYVEQAMNEVYACIGSETVDCLQDAYRYTVDNMTYYDMSKGSNGAYVTKTNEQSNEDFKKKFMSSLYSTFGTAGGNNIEFVSKLDNAISNKEVKLKDYDYNITSEPDGSTTLNLSKKPGAAGISVIMYDKNGEVLINDMGSDNANKVDKIIIKNIVLSRTAKYNRSTANGEFTQTLSADIVIDKPNFNVDFNNINTDYSSILEYAMVADMGIDISQLDSLTISGNIYAAADFYNKEYNFIDTSEKNPNYSYTEHTRTADGVHTFDNFGYVDKNEINSKIANNTFKSVNKITEKVDVLDDDGNPMEDEDHNRIQKDVETGDIIHTYRFTPVTSKVLVNKDGQNLAAGYNRALVDDPSNTYVNSNLNINYSYPYVDCRYDGINEASRYSGLYISGTNVDLVSSMVIVPGTIAVMNSGSLQMFGINSNKVRASEVWTDNIVLGGYSIVNPADTSGKTRIGSEAVFNANLYVKDDLQIDSTYSNFVLSGSYYGYGDSTKRDNRVFTPMVDPENFKTASYVVVNKNDTNYQNYINRGYSDGDYVFQDIEKHILNKENGKYYYNGELVDKVFKVIDEIDGDPRGHYNSSAIIINGEKSNIDLSTANAIYIAGRSYIELSKNTKTNLRDVTAYGKAQKVDVKTYTFDAEINDYRTGDSLAVKPSQNAYMPASYEGVPVIKTMLIDGKDYTYYEATLPNRLRVPDSVLGRFFGQINEDSGDLEVNTVPVMRFDVSGKTYYYYDFKAAYAIQTSRANSYVSRNGSINNPDQMAEQFVIEYQDAIENDLTLGPYLTKIDDIEDASPFKVGNISMPADRGKTRVYSSGAIQSKDNVEFTITTSKSLKNNALNSLFHKDTTELYTVTQDLPTTSTSALQLSDDFEKKYNYVKFALDDIPNSDPKKTLVDEIVGYHNATEDENDNGIDGTNVDNAALTQTLSGESAITPINTFLDFYKIDEDTLIVPGDMKSMYTSTEQGAVQPTGLTLGSGNDVFISYNDITINKREGENGGEISGIILCKGDVIFAPGVTKFNGLIVSGGKVYISNKNNIKSINASPEICRAIFNELQLITDDESTSDVNEKETAEFVLKLFKSNQDAVMADESSTEDEVKIETLDYSSVVRYDNWTKDVE